MPGGPNGRKNFAGEAADQRVEATFAYRNVLLLLSKGVHINDPPFIVVETRERRLAFVMRDFRKALRTGSPVWINREWRRWPPRRSASNPAINRLRCCYGSE